MPISYNNLTKNLTITKLLSKHVQHKTTRKHTVKTLQNTK